MAATIISTITTAISTFLTGIGTAIVDFFKGIVMNADGTTMTEFATWALVFLGIGFALSVVTAILRKVG